MRDADNTGVKETKQPATGLGSRARWASAALTGVLFVVVAAVLWSGQRPGRAAFDEGKFHEPTVRAFAAQWEQGGIGSIELRDYRSATTPGYHLALAAVSRYVSDEIAVLRAVASVFALALVVLVGWSCVRSDDQGVGGLARALGVGVCLLASDYVLFPALWLGPDNAGWLGVLVILLLGFRAKFDRWTIVLGGVTLVLLVLVRQVHVWSAAVLWTGAWLGVCACARTSTRPECAPVQGEPGGARVDGIWGGWWRVFVPTLARVKRSGAMIAVSVPAFAVLAVFWLLWDGLTPPMFLDQYPKEANWATGAFSLSLLGIYSVFFGGYVVGGLARVLRSRWWWLVPAGCVAGLACALGPETTYLFEQRSGGLWNVVKRAPVLFDRTSVVLLALAPAGAAALVGWAAGLGERDRWVFLGAVVAFLAAQTATPLAWQRYHEPFWLIVVALASARVVRGVGDSGLGARAVWMERWWRVVGPWGLAALLSLITMGKLLPSGSS